MPAEFLKILNGGYDALVIANGAPLKRRLFAQLSQYAEHLVALDGGVNTLYAYDAPPDIVAGDMDSASPKALAWAKEHGAETALLPSQDAPDIAKGLEFCYSLGWTRLLIAGYAGARTDHMLGTLSFALQARSFDLVLVTDDLLAFPLRGRVRRSFEIPADHMISWFGCPEAGPCTLEGVRWPVKRRTLRMDGFHSLSNLALGAEVRLSQQAGRSFFFVSLLPQLRTSAAPVE
jgi:thiamine pyrophosphokinase